MALSPFQFEEITQSQIFLDLEDLLKYKIVDATKHGKRYHMMRIPNFIQIKINPNF